MKKVARFLVAVLAAAIVLGAAPAARALIDDGAGGGPGVGSGRGGGGGGGGGPGNVFVIL